LIPTWPTWFSYVILYGFVGHVITTVVTARSKNVPFSTATRKAMQIEAFLFWPLLVVIFLIVYVCTLIREMFR
jgi:hypothetical protein